MKRLILDSWQVLAHSLKVHVKLMELLIRIHSSLLKYVQGWLLSISFGNRYVVDLPEYVLLKLLNFSLCSAKKICALSYKNLPILSF